MSRLTFVLGAALLIVLGQVAGDPLWTWWSSLLAAVAARATAASVVATWVGQRRVTVKSLMLFYVGVALPFDIAQVVVLGTWRLDLAAGNLVAAALLFLAAGLVWTVDLRRQWLPAGAAAACCTVALLSWVPW